MKGLNSGIRRLGVGWRVCAELGILAVFLVSSLAQVRAADTLLWNTNTSRVTANIKQVDLNTVLRQIANRTGWNVFVEPGIQHTISARFRSLPPGEALPLLLGKLNFALVPGTNSGSSRLMVFQTASANATQVVPGTPTSLGAGGGTNVIPNQLLVRLKPGANIAELAKKVGAKVTGKINGQDAYRLEFKDEEAAESARQELSASEDVLGVDNNYTIDRPPSPASLDAGGLPRPPQLQLKPPPDDGRLIIGLIDTAVQPLGNDLDKFLLKQISVAGDASLAPGEPSHGTSMAETMLRSLEAITKGSTSVQILPVDVYGANSGTTTFDVAAGIVQAVNNGAKVINLSLGSDSTSPFLHDIVKEVSQKNIAIFAAAGNEPVTTPFYPAAYPEVTAVTAVDKGQIAPYANRGSFVSLGAPGTSVIYFNNQPYYVTGTSASAAFTSGIAAGYMDATKSGVDKMRTFLTSNFGLKTSAGP